MDEDYTADYINKRLADKCKLKAERKQIVVEFYEDGELVRVDLIFPETIDPDKVHYSEEENAVLVSCYDAAGKCVEREIFKLDRKLGYNRCNLAANCTEGDCKALETAVIHLINLYVLDDYERTQPFEEN